MVNTWCLFVIGQSHFFYFLASFQQYLPISVHCCILYRNQSFDLHSKSNDCFYMKCIFGLKLISFEYAFKYLKLLKISNFQLVEANCQQFQYTLQENVFNWCPFVMISKVRFIYMICMLYSTKIKTLSM